MAPAPWRTRFTPLADADVAEAYDAYEGEREGLGEEFLEDLGRAVAFLEEHPEGGPAAYRDLRRVLLHRFPYSLYYRLVPSERLVEVRACVHQRRHPRAWCRRGA